MLAVALPLLIAASPESWRRGAIPAGFQVSGGLGVAVVTSNATVAHLAQAFRLELDVHPRVSLGLEGSLVRGVEYDRASFGNGTVGLLARVFFLDSHRFRGGFGAGLEAGAYGWNIALVRPCAAPVGMGYACQSNTILTFAPTAELLGEWWPWQALGFRLAARSALIITDPLVHRLGITLQVALRL